MNEDVSQGKLATDREREFSAVVVDRHTGLAREITVRARGLSEAGFLAHAHMTETESIDSITD